MLLSTKNVFFGVVFSAKRDSKASRDDSTNILVPEKKKTDTAIFRQADFAWIC